MMLRRCALVVGFLSAGCAGAGGGTHCQSGAQGTNCYDHEAGYAYGERAQEEPENTGNERPGYVPPNPSPRR